LVSDVDFDRNWLEIGTRMDGADFTKGRTSFRLPFPPALRPILVACIDGRAEGPLLRSRRSFGGESRFPAVASLRELEQRFAERLAEAPAETVANENDRKQLFRQLLVDLGGISANQLGKEFKRVVERVGLNDNSIKDLRSSVSSDLMRSGIGLLDLRYITSHSTSDILNEYVTLDPVGAMGEYFATIRPLLEAIEARSREFGLGADST
jgi:hypothetical protein